MLFKIKKIKLNKKMLCTIIVIGFLTLSINQITADQINQQNTDELCYGFIISYLNFGNFTKIDQINCRIRHMINDLLRDKIQVYWTVENITINITKMKSEFLNENRLFERGSFIVPFTGNETDDKKIISVMYDYNQSSEIDLNEEIEVPIFLILGQINTEVLPLNEVKIAQFYSRVTTGGFLFLKLIDKCGFLNYNVIKDEDVFENLKLENYNVMFHPGGIFDTPHYLSHMIYEDIIYKKSDGIRSFVNNGGGYIGSCGGLTKAGAGGKLEPLPIAIHLRKKVYNPNLRSFGLLAIADILIQESPKQKNPVQVKIKNHTSPLTIGIDDIVLDYWYGGPQVYETGENVDVIADYHNTGTENDGTPVWLTSNFGSGKAVIFSTHPEMTGAAFRITNYSTINTGRTVITNSLYYTTSKEKIDYTTYFSKDIDYVNEIFNKTANLNDTFSEIVNIFDSIREEINNTKDYIEYLTNNATEIISIISDIASQKNVNLSDKVNKYYLGLDYIKDFSKYYFVEFIKYLNESFKVFNKIELLHDLLKNNTEYANQLESLLSEISTRINEMKDILKESQDLIDYLKDDLLEYEQKIFRYKIIENGLKLKSNSLYIHVHSGFSQVPQIYQSSLKFLRQQWYDYESNVTL